MLAAPFDLGRLEISGSPVAIEDGLMVYGGGAVQYAISGAGTLVYRPLVTLARSLISVDRQGVTERLSDDHRHFFPLDPPRLSPDGNRIAATILDGNSGGVWIYDTEQNTLSPLTEGGGWGSTWTHDGSRVVFVSNTQGSDDVYWRPWDQSAPAEALLADTLEQGPSAPSPDGRLLFLSEFRLATGIDISVLSIEEGSPPEPFLDSRSNETVPAVSPDGGWVAYASDQSGRYEVYVRGYPEPGPRIPVSRAGGFEPVWARNGRELFYHNGDSLMVARVEMEGGFRVLSRTLLFRNDFVMTGFDVYPDGDSFVMTRDEELDPQEMVVVLNWFEELRRKMAELGGR